VNRILNGALKDIVKDGGGQTLDPSSTYASAWLTTNITAVESSQI
jgi:hypothetical protein